MRKLGLVGKTWVSGNDSDCYLLFPASILVPLVPSLQIYQNGSRLCLNFKSENVWTCCRFNSIYHHWEELCHKKKEHVTTPVQFWYVRLDVLFYAVTVSQRKVTRHETHMKFELNVLQHFQSSRLRDISIVMCLFAMWHSFSPVSIGLPLQV